MEFHSRCSGSVEALLVGVDGGARDTLESLAAPLSCELASVDDPAAADQTYWSSLITATRPRVAVVGTSDSVRGRGIESAARMAARAAGLPIVAIEDFPGNYYEVPRGEASLLLVESVGARNVCELKWGSRAPPIAVAAAARYDRYRARAHELRHATREAWARQSAARVLWAGQPETLDGLKTLKALLPLLRTAAVELLFKAHPRDAGYSEGAYHALLEQSGVAYADVTHASTEDVMTKAPRLVATQFSSLAIEAGFYGVPGFCILLPEAGGTRLVEKKGYALPPLCVVGGAACATDRQTLTEAFPRTLSDETCRRHLLEHFDAYFGGSDPALPRVMKCVRDAALRGK